MALNDFFEKIKNATTKSTTNVDNNIRGTANDGMNLSGVNNISSSRGTPKSVSTQPVKSTDYNLAGTNNIRNAVGTPSVNTEKGRNFTETYNKPVNSAVVKANANQYQNTLSGVADASSKAGQRFLNNIGDTFNIFKNDVSDYFIQNKQNAQNTQAGLAYQRLEAQRQDAIDTDENNRNEIYNSITQEDYNKFFNQDGSAKDFDSSVRSLRQQIDGFNELLNSEIPDTQRVIVQDQIAQAQNQLAENEDLLKKYKAYEEKSNLDYYQSIGDEDTYNSLREAYSHKNDNMAQRFGTAMTQLVADTINEIPQALEQLKLTGQSTYATQSIDELNALHNTGQLSDDAYAEGLKYWNDALNEYRNEYNDGFSQVIKEASVQLQANTYYDASQIETFVLQAGYSTAQFLEHYAIGLATAGVATGALALESGGQIATGTMSLASAVSKTNQLIEEGYSPDIAYKNGLLTGLVSYATEKVGMDRFVEMLGTPISVNALGQIIQTNLRSAMSEGLEEVVEGIVDPLVDSVTLGTDYEVNGSELLMSFALGGTSGLLMATGANVGSMINSSIQVNDLIRDMRQNRAETFNEIGRLRVNTREQYNKLANEVGTLRDWMSSMTDTQLEVANELINQAETALNEYAQKSTTMGVVFSYEIVENPTPEQNTQTIYEACESDFNQEVQTERSIDELQAQVDSDIEQLAMNEINFNNATQETLNRNGYNIDARVFNSLSEEQQNQALVAYDFAKIMGIDLNVTDYNGIRQILTNSGFSGTEAELNRMVNGTRGFVTGDGRIFINGTYTDGNNKSVPILFTLTHELTHGTESSEYYPMLKEIVKGMYDSGNVVDNNNNTLTWEQALENKTNDYKGIADFDAEKEVVARYVEDKLGDEKFIDDLIRYNYSLASRIWQDLKSAGNDDEVSRIRNAFEKAFNKVADPEVNNQSNYFRFSFGEKGDNSNKDSDGEKLSKAIINRFKGTKLTDDKGNLLRIYHTSPRLFTEFDPTQSANYRFGDKVVNYYSTNPTVSGSYTDGNYSQVKTEEDIDTIRNNAERWTDLQKEINRLGREFTDFEDAKSYDIRKIAEKGTLNTALEEVIRNLNEYEIPKDRGIILGYGPAHNENFHENIGSRVLRIIGQGRNDGAGFASNILSLYDDLSNGKYMDWELSQDFIDLFEPLFNAYEDISAIREIQREIAEKYQEIKTQRESLREEQDKYQSVYGKQYVGYGKSLKPYVLQSLVYSRANWDSINELDYRIPIKEFDDITNNIVDVLSSTDYEKISDLNTINRVNRFVLDNVSDDVRNYLVQNPVVLANVSKTIAEVKTETRNYYPDSNTIADEVGRSLAMQGQFNSSKGNTKFNRRLETNDVVKAVLAINDYIDTPYDGVIFKNITDSGSESALGIQSDIIALFNSNQFKLIGNENPSDSSDIRFSLGDGSSKEDIRKEYKNWSNDRKPLSLEEALSFDVNGKTVQELSDVAERIRQYVIADDVERIRANEQYTLDAISDETRQALEKLDEIARTIPKTLNDNSAERKRYRVKLIQEMIDKEFKNVPRERKAWIVLGPSASGKSSFINKYLGANGGVIDSDEFKFATNEFKKYGGIMSDALHAESDELARVLKEYGIDNGFNLIFPLVGKNSQKIQNLVSELQNAGYNVNISGTVLPAEKAQYRALNRFIEDDRYLRLDYMNRIDGKPTETYNIVKEMEGVEDGGLWNTDVPKGQEFTRIEMGWGNQPEIYGRIPESENPTSRLVRVRDSRGNEQYSNNIISEQDGSFLFDSDGTELTTQQQDYFRNSKIRNEDGNLLVVYHGTNEKFTVFDRTKGRANMDVQGMFFSPWEIDAGGYGSNVDAYYLNIENPASAQEVYRALNMFKGENNAGVKAREYLESRGYDGASIDGEEYIAFYPEQIKKINNVNPTGSPDIRMSYEPDTQKGVQEDSDRSEYYDYGMNPARNVDILRETEAGPTSRYWNNLANSQYVSDEEAQRIKTMVENGLGAYERTSREKQETEAKKLLRNMGMEDAFKYMMNADSVATMSVDNTLGRLLQSEMRQKGLEDTDGYRELSARMQWRATMQGQALEAWKGYRDSTPEGQIVTIRSEVERIQQGLNERYGDRANNIVLNEDLIAQYLRARNDTERDSIKEQIARDVAKQIPPSALEQLNSFRHLSMLFNPRTWIKNNLANRMFGYINEGTRTVRSVMETVLSNVGGSTFENLERQAGTYNPLSSQDRALYKRFKSEYGNEFKNIDMKYSQVDAGNILLGTEFGEEVSRYRDQFTSKFLNKLSKINAKMMSDAPGMSTAYAKSMVGYLKANNLDINNMTDEQLKKAKDFAINEAKYATFNSYNKLASDIAKFSQDGSMARRVIVESFLPFKRTPLNLLRTGFRYTPVGLADSMTRQFAQLKNGNITANDWINNVAQGMTGSALMVLGMLLSQMGLFRTKDDDPDRKQYLDQELGEQEYSLNWDGASYTIDWIDPMIVPLAMGAELIKYVQRGEYSLDDAVNMVAGLADPMFETSMLSGISKNLSSYSTGTTQWWGKIAQNAVTNYVSQYIPSVLGATARTIDSTRRSTYTDKGAIDRFIRTSRNKIPGLSQLNEPYINRGGEEERNEDLGMGIAGRAVLNFLSPGYYSSKEIDEYDEEMYRLYDTTGEIDSLPSNSSKSLTFDGENYKFSPEQYTEWQRTRWSTEAEYVNQFMDSQAYKNLDDAERVATIKDIRSYAQKVAKKQFLESQGIEYNDDKQLNNAQGAMNNGIELYAYFDYLNNGGSKQAEKMAYLEQSGLSQAQKEYLWSLNGYKKSYADVYASVFGASSNSSSKNKKSSKSSKKSSGGKISLSGAGGESSAPVGSSGATALRGGTGRANMVGAQNISPTSNRDEENDFVNRYLSAYTSSINRGNNISTGNASVVCPNCGNRVNPANGRCPVCGNPL